MEKKVQLTRMIVVMEDYYTYAEPMAFNHRKYRWEKIPVNAEAEHPERYMDENGNIYIQLRPANGIWIFTPGAAGSERRSGPG